ncbi:Os12g0116900, partial [Oryza sativa Japonica Group]
PSLLFLPPRLLLLCFASLPCAPRPHENPLLFLTLPLSVLASFFEDSPAQQKEAKDDPVLNDQFRRICARKIAAPSM